MKSHRISDVPHSGSTAGSARSSLRIANIICSLILLSCVCLVTTLTAQTADRRDAQRLTGHEDHTISLAKAAELTRNYRKSATDDAGLIKGEFFGKDALMKALSQKECIGIRFYYGKTSDGTPALVFVGVDKTGDDILSGFIGELGLICPPICHEPNPLTTDEFPVSGVIEEDGVE